MKGLRRAPTSFPSQLTTNVVYIVSSGICVMLCSVKTSADLGRSVNITSLLPHTSTPPTSCGHLRPAPNAALSMRHLQQEGNCILDRTKLHHCSPLTLASSIIVGGGRNFAYHLLPWVKLYTHHMPIKHTNKWWYLSTLTHHISLRIRSPTSPYLGLRTTLQGI